MSRELRLKFVLDALDRVTGPLQNISKGASKTALAMKATRDQLKQLDAAQSRAVGLREQREALSKTNQALDEARRKQRALRDELAASSEPSKRLKRDYEGATKAVEKLEQSTSKQAESIGKLSGEMRNAGVDVSKLGDHEKKLSSAIDETNRSLDIQNDKLRTAEDARRKFDRAQELGGKLQSQGAMTMATGVAATLPAMIAAKKAMSFEDAAADANKVLNLTNDEFAKMKRETLDLSRQMPLSPQAIMQIKAAGAEMRIAKGELNAFAEGAGTMAVAFTMDAADAGAQMATWRSSFQMTQDEVMTLGDQINLITNKMGGDPIGISNIVTKVGPLGRVSGVAAGSLAAMAGTLATAGIQSEVAGTGIKNMMLALTKGDSATKKQSAAFEELGLNASGMAERMQKDATGAITDILSRIASLSPEKQSAMLTRLFGSESVSAIAPMLTNLEDLKTRLDLVGDANAYAGSMTEEYDARKSTTSAQLQLTSNKVDALQITLGERLLPIIQAVSDKIGSLADGFSNFAEANPKLTNALVIAASAIGPLLIGLGALGIVSGTIIRGVAFLALGFGKLVPVFAAAKTAFLIVATALRYVAALMMVNPIIAIITGIGLAVLIIYKNWDTIGPWLSDKLALLRALFNQFLGWVKGLLPNSLVDAGKQMIAGLWSGIMAKKDWLMGKLSDLGKMIPKPIRKALDINSPSRVFADIGGHLMSGLDQGIAGGSNAPLARMSGLSQKLVSAVAAGAVGPALALGAAPASAASPTSQSAANAASAPVTYQITVNANGGDGQQIADQVRAAIEQIERDKRARGYSDY